MEQAYTNKYCRCKKTDNTGPWCDEWLGNNYTYCILFGGEKAKYCPFAEPTIGSDEWFTSHQLTCDKSKRMYIFLKSIVPY